MPEILQWNEIRQNYQGGALLLGNGASMAVHPGFGYASLREAAEQCGHISPAVAEVFKSFGTNDFELVLRRLWDATLVNKALQIEPGKVEQAYQQVRDALIATVRQVHISYEDAAEYFEAIYGFMCGFKTVLSLNYDLIVYWSMMASRASLGNWFKDCFQQGGIFREDWKTFRKFYRAQGSTLVFYPHGNLITARRNDFTEGKLAVEGGDADNLLGRILELWEDGSAVPLFVCEGRSDHKKQAIGNSNYLARVFREVIRSVAPSLVIYGWSVSEQDQHILDQIRRSGVALQRVAVSVYGGNQNEAQRMEESLRAAGIRDLVFFDAESPGCWIHLQEDVVN